jgi:DNA-binding response OmpR family regulator
MDRKGYILVVENDDLIRELLERWLGEAGYAVVVAGHGTMRAPPRADTPCLVIVNVASPRGAQPLIQSLQAVYAAPILVVSGRFRRGLAGSAEAAHRLGVKKVLPKPFTCKDLLSAVHEALEAAE